MYPKSLVLKNDSGYIQGIPDLQVIIHTHFGSIVAFLEVKRNKNAHHQPNQDYYVNQINEEGGFARFIYPENTEDVLSDMRRYFNRALLGQEKQEEQKCLYLTTTKIMKESTPS